MSIAEHEIKNMLYRADRAAWQLMALCHCLHDMRCVSRISNSEKFKHCSLVL